MGPEKSIRDNPLGDLARLCVIRRKSQDRSRVEIAEEGAGNQPRPILKMLMRPEVVPVFSDDTASTELSQV